MDHECIHFKECSGCEIRLDATPSLVVQAREYFSKYNLFDVPFIRGNGSRWRIRSKLAVRGSTLDPHIGLFKRDSHSITSIPNCLVHHTNINKAVKEICSLMQERNICPYDEVLGSGVLRYIQCVIEKKTGKVQLSLVVNATNFEHIGVLQIEEFAYELQKKTPDFWHSIWINLNNNKGNRIFGRGWKKVCGEAFLWEELLGVSVCFSPASFGQANLDLFEKMLLSIKNLFPKNARVLELYAGVGAIGLSLVHFVSSLTCVEENPLAKEMFLEAKKKLSPEISSRLKFESKDVSSCLDLIKEADVIIVDPPRKGLDPKLLDALCQTESKSTLIYISCGWHSFQKDSEILIKARWKLVSGALYLFFPGTNHIETLALFSKE